MVSISFRESQTSEERASVTSMMYLLLETQHNVNAANFVRMPKKPMKKSIAAELKTTEIDDEESEEEDSGDSEGDSE